MKSINCKTRARLFLHSPMLHPSLHQTFSDTFDLYSFLTVREQVLCHKSQRYNYSFVLQSVLF